MKKLFRYIIFIGFWGTFIHPVMLIPFAIGVFGYNHSEGDDDF